MHRPIKLQAISLRFPHKTCFSDFSAIINHGDRIAIIGNNGAGKSSLLNMLCGNLVVEEGAIKAPAELNIGFLAQVVLNFAEQSGGERLNKALSEALALKPNCLLLDEPTNHLDNANRRSLLRLLKGFSHTLIIVSHDLELLTGYINTIWHIDDGKINVFNGSYDDYQREYQSKRSNILKKIEDLNRQKQANHEALMREQTRAHSSRRMGEKSIRQRKWPTIVSSAKARRAEETSGRLRSALSEKKQELSEELSTLRAPEVIKAKFFITSASTSERTILSISNGSIGYESKLVSDINLSLMSFDHLAIVGKNASGKTTLIKAILGDSQVKREGLWHTPRRENIGYLDQHYENLDPQKSGLEIIERQRPDWSHLEIRKHLNHFLFRKNEEVNNKVGNLSGGEKARLSLALIASYTPQLLILDELTNNLDLESKKHIITVIRDYPGAMLVISHDQKFLEDIGVKDYFRLGHSA